MATAADTKCFFVICVLLASNQRRKNLSSDKLVQRMDECNLLNVPTSFISVSLPASLSCHQYFTARAKPHYG